MKRLTLLGLLIAACVLACASSAVASQSKITDFLKGPNPLLSSSLRAASTVTYGTDTYGGAAGVASSSLTHFNCSYLSGVVGKDWTRGDIDAWHAQGKPTCVVFEQGATQAEDGFGQGNADAHRALDEANALGVPSYVPIHFAVDCDCSGEAVKEYFLGAKSVLGPRTGVYGSYYVVRDLVEWGIVANTATWQTRGWSDGMVWGGDAIYQYAIPNMAGTVINGQQVDLDWSKGVGRTGTLRQAARDQPTRTRTRTRQGPRGPATHTRLASVGRSSP